MTTLTTFLLDRIAEDEETARLGIGGQMDPENGWGYEGRALTPHVGVIHHAAQAEHITRWHPARVLAESEAKRRIVAEHGPEEVASLERGSFGKAFVACRRCQTMAGQIIAPCPTLRLLAQVYADHPDYQPEWSTND